MAIIRWEDTLACLEIEPLGADRFTAPNIPMEYRRVFGGQLLAQGLCVAAGSVEGKSVKSIHATFPAEGDLAERVEYRLDRLGEGRTYAHRVVRGEQGSRTIMVATISLHGEEDGLFHQSETDALAGPEEAVPVDLSMIPWETRAVDGVDLASREAGPPRYAFWMRTNSFEGPAVAHQALLAHASDLAAIGTCLRPHAGLGESDSPERIQTAVTSHTLWFHREVRVDDWLLLRLESPVAAGGRGFALGNVFDQEGTLLASFAQESLLRPLS